VQVLERKVINPRADESTGGRFDCPLRRIELYFVASSPIKPEVTPMTRFIGAVLIIATLSTASLAQQKEPTTENKTKESASPFQRLKEVLSKLDSLSLQSQLPGSDMQWISEEGGLFITFGDMKIPVAGGGASGCFTRDLRERIEKLRIVIEAIRNVR
jgi:hypothetical protein